MTRVAARSAAWRRLRRWPPAARRRRPPQSGAKKADAPGWKGANRPISAPGWTPGDQTSWEAQLRDRAQAQNDYAGADVERSRA